MPILSEVLYLSESDRVGQRDTDECSGLDFALTEIISTSCFNRSI